jgi:hypothetical protein
MTDKRKPNACCQRHQQPRPPRRQQARRLVARRGNRDRRQWFADLRNGNRHRRRRRDRRRQFRLRRAAVCLSRAFRRRALHCSCSWLGPWCRPRWCSRGRGGPGCRRRRRCPRNRRGSRSLHLGRRGGLPRARKREVAQLLGPDGTSARRRRRRYDIGRRRTILRLRVDVAGQAQQAGKEEKVETRHGSGAS